MMKIIKIHSSNLLIDEITPWKTNMKTMPYNRAIMARTGVVTFFVPFIITLANGT